ncbi:MAG: polysaccharide pyruvyl transferase family protein [Pseudobutyrivibrio ruminis]|nr:polysaccharide pyruvyl transferase family protein [Pseudobutyrivibrio ruminis]
MKFANIYFDGNRKGSVNIGDDLQLVAIENLYKEMGINYDDEVVRIGLSELSTYDGEYVVLPISFPLYGYREGTYITMFSPKIIPVFLALSIMSGNISQEECDYFRRFEPIGCRDYYTANLLRKNNIMAYVNGCMTVTFPKQKNLFGSKVYLVDVPESYYKYIPLHILEESVMCSQVLYDCANPEKEIKNRLEEYARNASLIITTRLHCAMPCLAMGLPVILMKDKYSFRFTFVSKYIHVYEKEEFSEIDWNPKSIDFEPEKRKILDLAKKRITETWDKYYDMYALSEFYEKSNIRKDAYIEHFDNVKEFIDKKFNQNECFRYAVWGITQKADMICSYIESNYKNARLSYVYDKNKKIEFHGVMSGNDDDVITADDIFVFVTAATANPIAKEKFEKIGKTNYHISDDGIDVSRSDENDRR